MGQRAGKAGGQPRTPAGWQGVPLSSGLPPISLGCCPHFCKEILGPGFKLQEEAGRAAAGRCGYPSWGGQHADVASGERHRLGYVFTSCFFKSWAALASDPVFSSFHLFALQKSQHFSPPLAPPEMLASREKGGGGGERPNPNNPMNKQTNLEPRVGLSVNLHELGSVLEGGELCQGVAWVLPATLLHWVRPAISDHYVAYHNNS